MIRKIVGVITLIGCSLFVGCEDEIIIASEDISSETVSFNVRLPIDENGYIWLFFPIFVLPTIFTCECKTEFDPISTSGPIIQ